MAAEATGLASNYVNTKVPPNTYTHTKGRRRVVFKGAFMVVEAVAVEAVCTTFKACTPQGATRRPTTS